MPGAAKIPWTEQQQDELDLCLCSRGLALMRIQLLRRRSPNPEDLRDEFAFDI